MTGGGWDGGGTGGSGGVPRAFPASVPVRGLVSAEVRWPWAELGGSPGTFPWRFPVAFFFAFFRPRAVPWAVAGINGGRSP